MANLRTHDELARTIIRAICEQNNDLRTAGVPAHRRIEAMVPGIAGMLEAQQDALLEAQRETALALEAALGRK